jgi:hypothetical protein
MRFVTFKTLVQVSLFSTTIYSLRRQKIAYFSPGNSVYSSIAVERANADLSQLAEFVVSDRSAIRNLPEPIGNSTHDSTPASYETPARERSVLAQYENMLFKSPT